MDNALEVHAHYSKLFEAFTVLPPDDIGGALFERACELWAESPWSDFGRFLGRVESYLEQSRLTPERREKVEAFLNKQKLHYERGCWLVETRPRIIELDEQDLKNRLRFMTEARGLFPDFEAIKPHEKDEYLAKVRAEVERRLSFLVHQRESPAAAQPVHAAALHPQAGKLMDYFHLSGEAITRQNKMRGEARDAACRQATINNVRKHLTGERRMLFNSRYHNTSNIIAIQDLADDELFLLSTELTETEYMQLEADIYKEAKEIEACLPYSDGYRTWFIQKLSSERLDTVADFLSFTCSFGMPGCAGFFVLNQPEDAAYLRDIIIDFVHSHSNEVSPLLTQRAIEWLTAQRDVLKIEPTPDTHATPATTAPPQPVIPVASLSPEEEKIAYYRRWDEFRNVVNISYSTPEDDATVTVYDVSGAEPGDGPAGLWCPLQCAGVPLESWQDYPEGKREAIRRGFMYGLCNMIGMTPPATLANWQYFRPEICKPDIYGKHFNPLNEQTHRTGNYAAGRREIEKWLTTIYAAGVQIPFHPNFENELVNHLGRVPLTGVDAFLAGFTQRKGLATPEGYTYLLNVAIPLAEAPEAGRRTVMERVVSWLRLALDTPTAPATTKPLDTPAFTVIKSQAQVLSEMIAQIATDAEASANAKGFTLVGKPGKTVPPPPPQPLDNPPPPPLTERLPIDDVLAMPRAALDLILLDAAMIEPDTIPGRYKAKPTVKPWQWANVRAALQTKLLLAEINDEDAALLFTETYGAKVGRGTMQKRPQNEQNSKFKTRRIFAYAEFRDRLPASNPS